MDHCHELPRLDSSFVDRKSELVAILDLVVSSDVKDLFEEAPALTVR